MAPAEIWQGGKIVSRIEGNSRHQCRLNGNSVLVKDSNDIHKPGFMIYVNEIIPVGDSISLDDGTIVKAVKPRKKFFLTKKI